MVYYFHIHTTMQGGVQIPLTVPTTQEKTYRENFVTATRGTGRLFLFAGDQKVEHLNDDFIGFGIPPEASDPEHYFRIASAAPVGVFASSLGLIARYAADYPDLAYVVKLNGKTNLVPTKQQDPLSAAWMTVDDVVNFARQSGLKIVGIGYTIFLGSEREAQMLTEAATAIRTAHQHGLLATLWIYPRGKAVGNEKDVHLIAGAAGVGLMLGADFVKVNYPYELKANAAAKKFREAVTAAGRTGVICAGGSRQGPRPFLQHAYEQVQTAGARGIAVGRNIYQRPLSDAIGMAKAIGAIVLYNYTAEEAYEVYVGERELPVAKQARGRTKR